MKTKEELNALKEEVENLNKKLAELTEEELEQISGGDNSIPCYCYCPNPECPQYNERRYILRTKCEECGSKMVEIPWI